jgi:hypothetical protein
MNLQEIIKKIKKEGAHRGYRFISSKTLNSRAFVIAHKKAGKAMLIGEDTNTNIKCYYIDINKWMWAESEGFSGDEIVDKLFHEVFKIMKIKNPIDNAQAAKIARKLI